jgi:hypothetical protein
MPDLPAGAQAHCRVGTSMEWFLSDRYFMLSLARLWMDHCWFNSTQARFHRLSQCFPVGWLREEREIFPSFSINQDVTSQGSKSR